MVSLQSRDFPDQVFIKHKSKMSGDCFVFKFLWCVVDGKHLICTEPKTCSHFKQKFNTYEVILVFYKMAQTEQATQDMSKNWDDRVAESKQDIKVT